MVTGSEGLVGLALVARLRRDGWTPVSLSRRPPSSPLQPGETHLTSDVCSEGWERWCEGCSAAVNLVGSLRPGDGPDAFRAAHVTTVERLVAACRTLGISRIVSVSAVGAAAEAATPYLRSKWAGEQAVAASGLDWTVVRPTVVFGAGDRFTGGLARLVRKYPIVPVPGDGSARFQPVAAEDVAELLATLLHDATGSHGRVVEVGGPETLPLDELIRRVARMLGLRRSLIHVPVRLARALTRLAARSTDPLVTNDELTMLLAGASASPPPDELGLPVPTRRFADLDWLRDPAG